MVFSKPIKCSFDLKRETRRKVNGVGKYYGYSSTDSIIELPDKLFLALHACLTYSKSTNTARQTLLKALNINKNIIEGVTDD